MKPSTVREAKLSDCQILAILMEESAKEQETEGGLRCKDLEKKLFANHPIVETIVNEQEEGVITGYIIFTYRYASTSNLVPFISDLYVIPEHRRNGIATALWNAMVQKALALGCKNCEVIAKSPNEFLLSLGAFDATDFGKELVYEIEEEAIKQFIKRKDSPNKFTLREATMSDVGDIVEGVKALHLYLGKLHEVVCNETELLHHGFGKPRYLKLFVAEQNGVIVGYSMFSYTFGLDGTKIFMEDLYVSPECRGTGMGMALWLAILKEGLQKGISRCNHTVDAHNKPSMAFYKSHGAYDASQIKNTHLFKIPLDKISI
ncbi:spermidine/spermine N(1)-acetyltransferase-like protein 1 [Palaemon carinicauda]|uniref:spermidine/spermine N(1)-acetyltransferase-like protein 1 n=1 Tax=Palaemon carinicauda TaxID=392227 RepID=UPI0035B59034